MEFRVSDIEQLADVPVEFGDLVLLVAGCGAIARITQKGGQGVRFGMGCRP